jgi:hypothetical protein
MTRVTHSSQGLQLYCSCLQNDWRWLCLSPAECHSVPLRYWYISDAALSHICVTLRSCHLLQYSLRFGYIACRCICFAIIVFYSSEIYYLFLKHSFNIPSVHHILSCSIVGLRCFFVIIRIVAFLALIRIKITCSQVKHLEFSRGRSLLAGGGDDIMLFSFVVFTFVFTTAPWHLEMQFVIHAIVVYQDVWVNASDLTFLKRHFGGQIVKINSIVNKLFFNADHHGRRWVLRLLDLTLDCSKCVYIYPLLVALR